jgi:hypothetical protein
MLGLVTELGHHLPMNARVTSRSTLDGPLLCEGGLSDPMYAQLLLTQLSWHHWITALRWC